MGKKNKKNQFNFYKQFKNKKVLVTGHTGFKGSWLSLWLKILGARVIGLSINIPSNPSHFKAIRLQNKINHKRIDIRNLKLSIEYASKGGMISQSCLCITHSEIHTINYYVVDSSNNISDAYGGGFYLSSDSHPEIISSILWSNYPDNLYFKRWGNSF